MIARGLLEISYISLKAFNLAALVLEGLLSLLNDVNLILENLDSFFKLVVLVGLGICILVNALDFLLNDFDSSF